MKIIYLHQYFNTPSMTGSTRSYEFARRMVGAGHEVHMVTSIRESNSRTSSWSVTHEDGICVHWYPVPYSNQMSYVQRLAAFILFAKAARKKAVELEADVMFATSTPLTIALPAVFASRKKKIPLVFEVRDLWPEMPIAMGALNNSVLRLAAYKLEDWAYRNSAAVVALSPGMKRGVAATGYPILRVAVIPNCCDNGEFAYNPDAARKFRDERPWLGDNPLFVYTGTFGRVNGVGYMVELAKALRLRSSDIRILLIGDGTEREDVKVAAQQAGVYRYNLFIEDPLPKADTPALLSAATVASNLVIDLPEARANSANKFFDTLAAGKPIFLNHGGWMHDLVTEHECGLPMWGKPVSEVAATLDSRMRDKAWLASAGRSARKLAEDSFDRDVLAKQLLDVLQAAVDGRVNEVQGIAPGIYA